MASKGGQYLIVPERHIGPVHYCALTGICWFCPCAHALEQLGNQRNGISFGLRILQSTKPIIDELAGEGSGRFRDYGRSWNS